MPPHREEKKERAAVPQFGAWDQKAGGDVTGYSVVFTKAREKRKQTKVEVPPTEASAPAQEEFGPPRAHDEAQAQNSHGPRPHHPHSHSDPHNHFHPRAPHPNHRRRYSHSHPKAQAYDHSHLHSHGPNSSNKEDPPNKGMKKLLQCFGGGSEP